MSDDFNFFDDDSLMPDWMQDSSSEEEPASGTPSAGSAVPPWALHGGNPPPPPGRASTAPPWEIFRGAAPPPPSAPGTLPPWGETSAPVEDAASWGDLETGFDWSAPGGPVPDVPTGELPSGMTGTLPWREEPPPPQEPPRSAIRRITPSGDQPRPAQPSAENAEWLSGFGEAASFDMNAPSDELGDLDWLAPGEPVEPAADELEALIFDEAPAESTGAVPEEEPARAEAPSAFDDLEALFADEFPEPSEPVTEEEAEVEETEDFSWLESDLGDLPVLAAQEVEEPEAEEPEAEEPEAEELEPAQVLPEWMQAELDEELEPEEAEEAEEGSRPDWLSAPAEEPPAEEAPPRRAIRRIAPPAEEPPRRPIRRITPAAEEPPPAEPEAEENDMQAWLARMESGEPDEGQPDEMAGLTYEEWERLQAEKEREARKTDEDRLFEQGPDWFSQVTAQPGTPPPEKGPEKGSEKGPEKGPEFVPDWFLGLEEQKEEETPDWFRQSGFSADALTAPVSEPPPAEPSAGQPAASEVPDWFTGAALPGFDDTDWDAAFGPPPSEEKAPQEGKAPEPAPPPGPIRRITPPVEEPDWATDAPWETPEEAPMSQDEFELPDFEAGEEAPSEEEFVLPESDLGAEGEIAPGEVPDWLSQTAPEEPAEEEAPPEDEFALPEFDLEAEGEIAPSEVPDWLAESFRAAPASTDEELPLPSTGMLAGFDEERIEPSEVPDWLTADQDARATPDEVPFPEIDLDDTMPTEQSDLLGEAEAGEKSLESWMTDFEPGEGIRRPKREDEEREDFVERFEPLEPEAYVAPRPAPVDDEAPAWLREMADEGVLGDVPLSEEASGAPPIETGEAVSDFLAGEMDWLSEISAEDVEPEPAEEAGVVSEMPPKPDESIPELEPGTLHTAPLDSSAIDQLLSLYEPEQEPAPEEPKWEEAEALFEDVEAEEVAESPQAEVPEEVAPFEIGGVADWEWMAPAEGTEGEPAPDLEALFGEAAAGDLFPPPGEEKPRAEEEAEPPQRVPEVSPRFRERKPAPEAPEMPPAAEAPPAAEVQPEWLAEMRPSDLPVVVKAGGAEASITQKQVIELPERLRAFHEAAMKEVSGLYEEVAPRPPADSGPLAGIADALPVADLVLEAAARPVEGLVITNEQQARLARLQVLLDTVAAEEEELEEEKSQIEGLEPLDLEGLEAGEQPAPEAAPKRARRSRRFKPDRVIVALLLLAALIVPFATDRLHIASDPPALTGERLAVGSEVDTLTEGQYVLFALEYGPTSAGELDPLAEAVLRDVLTRGAIPLTISTDPAGAFHAQAVIDPLAHDAALLAARGQGETSLEAGQDYVLLRYLPGEAVGVRSLTITSQDSLGQPELNAAFKTDLRGDEIDLPISSVQDVALIVVVGAESSAVRTWAEQLNDVTVPKVALVGAAIEPLTTPYVNKNGYAGYLAGVRDTYSYNEERNKTNRTPYTMPDDAPVKVPDPDVSQWHSMALGAAAAAALIALGLVINLFRRLTRRQRR
jgi:hypothetical protein